MSRVTSSALILAICALTTGFATACTAGQNGQPEPGAPTAKAEELSKVRVPETCNFATHVLNLIAMDTNGTSLPNSNIGIGCTDPKKFSAYKSLF